MNSLATLQVLFFCFLLLSFVSVLYNPLALMPAILILLVQYLHIKRRVKPDYPEDYMKYLVFFCVFEMSVLSILMAFVGLVSSMDLLTSPQNLYTIFIFIIAIIFVTAAITALLKRRYTYGTVLFTYDDWAGVSIKNDLLARVSEGNYAVKLRKSGLRPKGRVRVLVEKERFGKPKPAYIITNT